MTLSVTPQTRIITNGTANDGSVVNANFTDLYTNDQTIATYVNNMAGGGISFSGLSMTGMIAQVFGSNIPMVSGVLTPPANGNIYYVNSTVGAVTSIAALAAGIVITLIFTESGFVLTNSANLILAGNRNYTTSANDAFTFVSLGSGTWQEVCRATQVFAPLTTKYSGSSPPVWVSNTELSMADILERDHTDTVDIRGIGANVTLNMATNGLNGIDNGTVAVSTVYYLYAVTNGATVGIMASTINENSSGTISNTNYAYTAKRQLRFGFATNSSGYIPPFYISQWGLTPIVRFSETTTVTLGTSLSESSFTSLSLASYVPAISTEVELVTYQTGAGGMTFYARPTGSGDTNGRIGGSTDEYGAEYTPPLLIQTNSSQSIDYKTSNSTGITLYLTGYTINGFN
jgi:hypothetical protein